jgi:hypothetical protein
MTAPAATLLQMGLVDTHLLSFGANIARIRGKSAAVAASILKTTTYRQLSEKIICGHFCSMRAPSEPKRLRELSANLATARRHNHHAMLAEFHAASDRRVPEPGK